MAQEEKLEDARRLYKDSNEAQRYVLELLFPELRESEDEKIRKWLIGKIKQIPDDSIEWETICKSDILAWLDRPSEEKSDDKIEPKFKVKDWVVRGNTIAQILDIQEQYYVGLDINGKDFTSSRFLNDDKIHLWTIKDAKDGDVLYDGRNACIFRKKMEDDDAIWVDSYCGVNSDGMFNVNDEDECWCLACDCVPATKEQRDLLFKKMKEAGYEWDAEKKELKKIEDEPNKCEGCNNAKGCVACVDGSEWAHIEESEPAWSKEDEQHIDSLLKRLDGLCRSQFERTRFAISEDEDWLKSLKGRYTWKPSEEQLSHLRFVCDNVYHMEGWNVDVLEELYNDLKNLK